MKEINDIAFAGAKLATMNNEMASVIVHGVSAGYNIWQMTYYRSLLAEYQWAMNNGYIPASMDVLRQYKRELTKHTVFAFIDVMGLICIGIAGLSKK